MMARNARALKAGRRSCRGATLPEMLVTCFILSVIVAATAGLYTVGQAQHRTARGYSEAQTEIRAALRRVTRTLRHGYAVVGPSSAGTLAGISSGPNRVIVLVPEPGGLSKAEILFYRSPAGVLYAQRHTEAAPGLALMSGVQALRFNYYKTEPIATGMATVPVDSTPQAATEVMITLTAVRQPATTTVKTYTSLRNAAVAF